MSLSLYQSYKPNSYPFDNATWDQGYPGYRSPPPYDVGSSPISDDSWAEDPDYDTSYPEKPGWSMTARHPNYGGFAPMRPGRAALYPGGDSGWRRTPGQASGFSSGSRCPECGKTSQTTDEWGWDGEDGSSSYFYANVTGYPYGSTPMQTPQQQSRYPRCSFCGQTRSTTTAYPQQSAGTQAGRAVASAPAQAEDTGSYYGPSSYPGYYPQEEWHTGSPGAPHTQFDNASMAYQGLYSSMGTGPYGHRWQQRHQGPYAHPPSGTPYDFQSSYYPTMDAFNRANQGISVSGYPYRIPGMGISGATRRGMGASYQYSNFYVTRSTGGMGMGPYGSSYGRSDGW